MAKAKKRPEPLANIFARMSGEVASNQRVQDRVEPLPHPITLEFFIPQTPTAKSAPFYQYSFKLKRNIAISDKKQVAAEKNARGYILRDIKERYPQYIPYLPLVKGGVSVWGMHFMPPSDDWYEGQEHLCQPDVDNLGKLLKDAPGARTKGLEAILYWDDCPVDDDWQRKVYWNPNIDDEYYPQCPGSIFVVCLRPPVLNSQLLYCDYCMRAYKTEKGLRKHLAGCDLYNL